MTSLAREMEKVKSIHDTIYTNKEMIIFSFMNQAGMIDELMEDTFEMMEVKYSTITHDDF